MDEPLQQSPESLAAQPLQVEAAIWQHRLDQAPTAGLKRLADQAVNAVNQRLAPETSDVAEMMVYCWGQGYYEDEQGKPLPAVDADGRLIHFGYSLGARVVEIPADDDHDDDLRLVHCVDIVKPNAIRNSQGHEIIGRAYLPVTNDNYLVLDEAAAIFESPEEQIRNQCQAVRDLGQNFADSGQRQHYRARQTPAEQEADARRVITIIEAKIGDKGMGLQLQSNLAYVIDLRVSGLLTLRPADDLRKKPRKVCFLGIGEFQALGCSGLAVNYRHFDQAQHDGLFMAVTMSDRATERAGLLPQALLVPLAGNSFDYTIM